MTSRNSSTCVRTSWVGLSVRWATGRRHRSVRPFSTSGTSSRRQCTHRRGSCSRTSAARSSSATSPGVSSQACDVGTRADDWTTMSETRFSVSRRATTTSVPARCASGEHRSHHADHRRRRGFGAEGHPGDPGGGADRGRGPAVLRSSAAGSGGGLPAVSGRDPRRRQRPADPQAAGLLHAGGGRRHAGEDPGHLAGRRQGSAREHGVPAHQPSAGLPDLRQGRRVPAAEPVHDPRRRRNPLHRRQAHLPEADQHLRQCLVGPGALRALCALHPFLRAGGR